MRSPYGSRQRCRQQDQRRWKSVGSVSALRASGVGEACALSTRERTVLSQPIVKFVSCDCEPVTDLPKVIHRYELIERLGRGGMGELYLARDPLLDRLVAIRVLRTGFEGSDVGRRFVRDARSAARLAHVNIVTIYDIGEHEGQPYIAMDYVSGETLRQQIERKLPLPLSTKLQYIEELCAGLVHGHAVGIVHRDIKPANLIISNDGPLKILDFGIARLADSDMTQERSVLGTLNYMSPEQLTGQPIDHRSDIWAVGAVFYELLTYQQAFPGGIDTGLLSRIIDARFTPLERVTDLVDRNLARIVERAMAKDRHDRFQHLKEMREELARVRQELDARSAALTTTAANAETVSIETSIAVPRTPSRGSNRHEVQRRRAEELAGYLAAAHQAFAAGRFEEAAATCERALILDEECDVALEISERAREAIEQNQIREWLGEARDELDHGNLTRARELVSRVFSLDANSLAAGALRVALDHAERQRRIGEIVARGRAALMSGDHASADNAVAEVLAADPSSAAALALRGEIDAAIAEERRRVDERRMRTDLERRAHEVIHSARRQFDSGDVEGAIALLAAFSPSHAKVSAMLEDLRATVRVIRDREAESQRRLQAELAQARAALASNDVTAAVSAAARASAVAPVDPQVAELVRAIDAQRAEIAARRSAEEEAERKAELEAKRETEEEVRRKAEEEKRRGREQAEREAAAKCRAEDEALKREELRTGQRPVIHVGGSPGAMPHLFRVSNRTMPVLDDNVQFTVFRPSAVQPARWYSLLAFAHLSENRPDAAANEAEPAAEVQRQAEQVLGSQIGLFKRLVQDSSHPVPQYGQLRFVPDVPGVAFNPPESAFFWTESVHRAEFRLCADRALDGQLARGALSVYLGRLLVAEITLAILVDRRTTTSTPTSQHGMPYRRIFASYSHDDSAVVQEFEHHVESLGDTYLRDVTSLRSGEVWSERLAQMISDADVFQLFWSWNALRSPFVRAEWEYALGLGRDHFIRPVFWESPLPSTPDLPPPRLRALHFRRVAPVAVTVDPLRHADGSETRRIGPPSRPFSEEKVPAPGPMATPPTVSAASGRPGIWLLIAAVVAVLLFLLSRC
jgi:tetratricopeptide (TPR) repeat protein